MTVIQNTEVEGGATIGRQSWHEKVMRETKRDIYFNLVLFHFASQLYFILGPPSI